MDAGHLGPYVPLTQLCRKFLQEDTAPRDDSVPPAELTEEEAALYARLARTASRNRLEQERIPVWWAKERLNEAVTGG